MNWKKIAPLAAAIILGLAAARMAMTAGHKPVFTAPAPKPRELVVVVTRDVEPGEVLKPSDLTMSPSNAPLPNSIVYRDVAPLVGRLASAPIPASQPVTRAALADGLQTQIPDGMRAITLDVNETSGVAYNLVPGCRIDVIQTLQDRATGEPVARTIAQDVEVTAVGVRQRPSPDGIAAAAAAAAADAPTPHSVTLLVLPRQAELLELATRSGTPRFALRKAGDHSTSETPGVTLAELRGRKPVEKAEPPAPKPVQYVPPPPPPATQPVPDDAWTIQVIRGGTESDVRFPLRKPAAVTKTDLGPIAR